MRVRAFEFVEATAGVQPEIMETISFIGFGEAAAAFAGCLSVNTRDRAGGYDIELNVDRSATEDRFSQLGLRCFDDAPSAVRDADIVVIACDCRSG